MSTLDYIFNKFWHINYISEDMEGLRMPIEIPNFGRDQLAVLFNELGFTIGAEIGVEQGVYAEILLKANPNLHLYAVDSWKAYRGYRDHTTQPKLDRFYEITKERLQGLNVELVRKFSMDAVKDFKDNSLDFVYIDGNHNFTHVAEDIHFWLRKVKPGGIISGHDYVKHKPGIDTHVYQVVNAYTDAYFIKPWFVLGTREVKEGEIRDHERSWMWVKQ